MRWNKNQRRAASSRGRQAAAISQLRLLRLTRLRLPQVARNDISEAGLSLIEFLIYFGILVFILVVTIQLSSGMLRISAREKSISEVNQNVRFVQQRFEQAVHSSKCITISAGDLVLSKTDASCATNTTTFHRDTSGGYGKVQLCDGTGCSYQNLTNNNVDVTALSFTKLSQTGNVPTDSVRMSITAIFKGASVGQIKYYSFTGQSTASLKQ